ncbi:MAG: HU family DNA-binding protein [Campylobacterota bacterium]|nr:HU family DNA-binding protein [Campylobacterota bacterium]
MNKTEFIEAAASKADLTKKDTGVAVDTILETVTETLSKGDSVSFIGFGTFSTSKRAARSGVNPSTGEKIQIAESTVAKFKAGSKLKTFN